MQLLEAASERHCAFIDVSKGYQGDYSEKCKLGCIAPILRTLCSTPLSSVILTVLENI